MAFTNLFRRNSGAADTQQACYACIDENSIAQTLLDELENQCQHSLASTPSKVKRNSEIIEHSGGLLASTYTSSPTRRSSADYSWLTPRNNLLQTQQELYLLPDILKMELSPLLRCVQPEDCTLVVYQFRRHIRSHQKPMTPENVIALFRKTLADYTDQKHRNRSHVNELCENDEMSNSTANALLKHNRIVPKRQSEGNASIMVELTPASLPPSQHELPSSKPRSRTYS